jgi:IS605 OrfB family transposase
MKTLIFGVNLNEGDNNFITKLRLDWSISYRKMFNNMELMKDSSFLNSLRIKSHKQIDDLYMEIEGLYKAGIEHKKEIQSHIDRLLSFDKLRPKQFKRLQRLKSSLNKKIIFGDKRELIKLSQGKGDKAKYKESRLLPLVFYGDASRYGNRFFNLKDIANGNIIFKMENYKERVNIKINIKPHKKVINQLQFLILNKQIPLTINLSNTELKITYDEQKLNGSFHDMKAFYKTIAHIKDKEERKNLIFIEHQQYENSLKKGKLDRYCAVDLNPDGIGYCILNKDNSVITKGYINISKILDANKRKYETSIMIKEIFKLMNHYRCHTIITEDLTNIKNGDYGNKVSNRKINNLWNRGLIDQLITKRCKEEKILRVEINPAYTSFIGNILHNEFDPIAASLEIGRRGINKYQKGNSFYPELNTTMFTNDSMYGEIRECGTWKDLKVLFDTAKRSYRRELDLFSFEAYNLGNHKSEVQHLHFCS